MTAGLEPLRVEQPREVSTSPRRTFSFGVLVGGLACCGLVAMVALFNKNASAPSIDKFFGVEAWNPSLKGSTRVVPRPPGTPVMANMAKGEITSGNVKRASTPVMAEMANGKMTFGNVKREWRCKWEDDGTGKASSPALVEIADLVDEYLPKIKELNGAVVNRNVCGGCLDFKLGISVPLDTFGPWETAGHPPEAEFLEKLGKIKGVSQIETQTMTDATL